MPIDAIASSGIAPESILSEQGAALPAPRGAEDGSSSFGRFLADALEAVSEAQSRAGATVERYAAGEPIDIHRVMIELEKASTAMALTVQVRNKLVEAYQEIMRTAV